MSRLVSFIDNEKLIAAVKKVVSRTSVAKNKINVDKNVLDAFSCLYESVIDGNDYAAWLKMEEARQIQKTMQNAIGDFHQEIIGGIDGWENLGNGNLVDVRSKQHKIIAEVKNKHNTVTGIHLIKIYDELRDALARPEHDGFTSYYVRMVAKKSDRIWQFTPPDRTTRSRRPGHPRILAISGIVFYEMITGQPDALFQLFQAIPTILEKECGLDVSQFKKLSVLESVFYRTYPRPDELKE